MCEFISRIEQLRFLARVQERDLARTRQWIEREEAAAARENQRRVQEAARQRPTGDWFLSDRPRPGVRVWLHTNECWDIKPGMRPITRPQALDVLTQDIAEPCPACRPERELGVLE